MAKFKHYASVSSALVLLACSRPAPVVPPPVAAASSAGKTSPGAVSTTERQEPVPPAPSQSGSEVGTAAPSAPVESSAPPQPTLSAPGEPVPTAVERSPRATLKQYYYDLNHRRFEAERYFAPKVTRYNTMKDTTPEAIERYLVREFPKQFESFEFLIDEETVREDGPSALVFSERCLYYLVRNHEFHNVVSEVRVEFDGDAKIVEFVHLRVLGRDVLPEQR